MAPRTWRQRALAAVRPMGFAAALLGTALTVAGPAAAAESWVSPDELTISGRWDLPRGTGTPLGGRLNVVYVVVDPSIAAGMGVKPEALKRAMTEAVNKSLFNFGYMAAAASGPPGAQPAERPIDVTIEVLPLTQTKDDKGTMVTSTIKLTAATDAGACFPYVATGNFHVLPRLKSGGDQRAVGVLAIVAFAAVGMDASQFARDQFETARANNEALNSRRAVGEAEGVAPPGGATAEARYGSISALQVAVAAMIQHLGPSGGCNAAPAAPAAPALQTVSAAATPVAGAPMTGSPMTGSPVSGAPVTGAAGAGATGTPAPAPATPPAPKAPDAAKPATPPAEVKGASKS